MNFYQKILGVTAVATLATSIVATSAPAHNPNNYKTPAVIFPALAGPVGAAALFPSTSTVHWTTTKIIPWSKTFTWTKTIFVNENTYWIKNIVGQGNQPWVNVAEQAYNNVNLSTHIREIRVIEVPKEITKTKTISGEKKVKTKHSKLKKTVGKAVVGCIFGSALGAISASIRKASAMGNPPRWRSQAEHERIVASGVEKKYELTNDEAHTAVALCGAGSLTLHWPQNI